MTATTRSSTTQSVLRYPIDDRPLATAKRLTLLVEFRFGIRLEPLEGPFIATEEFAVHRVVCDVQRERFDIGHVDERAILALEVARQETPLLESLSLGEVRPELDGDIEIGRARRRPREL
nr:hypothetical protein [Halorubrum aquaticum]